MKNKFILLLILAYSIIGCKPDVIGEPALYNFYFNINSDNRNIFNYSQYPIEKLRITYDLNKPSFPVSGSSYIQDSLFVMTEAAASYGYPDRISSLFLDFENGDFDTIAIHRKHPIYDIYYNDLLVQTYDLSNDEFEKEFWERNGYGSFSGDEDPIVITVEKRLEVQ